jgi:3-methyl-2-oxobutanoate hydroxymethyltransferase
MVAWGAFKLEGGHEISSMVRRISQVGVPVTAQLGSCSCPSATELSQVPGSDAACAPSVLEAIPDRFTEYITAHLNIPTIWYGAGLRTSGQVFVWDELLTRWHGRKANFMRRSRSSAARRALASRIHQFGLRGRFPECRDGRL